MSYLRAEFGDFSSSRFRFIVRTDRITIITDDRYTYTTTVGVSKYYWPSMSQIKKYYIKRGRKTADKSQCGFLTRINIRKQVGPKSRFEGGAKITRTPQRLHADGGSSSLTLSKEMSFRFPHEHFL